MKRDGEFLLGKLNKGGKIMGHDNEYLLGKCLEFQKTVAGYRWFVSREGKLSFEDRVKLLKEQFKEIELLVRPEKSKKRGFPLTQVVRRYEFDEDERAIVYFLLGDALANEKAKLERFMDLWTGKNSEALVRLKLHYFPTSRLIRARIISVEDKLMSTVRNEICGLPAAPEEKDDRKEAVLRDIASSQVIYDVLCKHVIGQEQAKRILSSAAYRHYCSFAKGETGLPKANVLLIGPTGSGKTHMVRILADILDVPFIFESMPQFSETGYVGRSISEIMVTLMERTKGNREKAERGIVFLDEIDKIGCMKDAFAHYTSRDVSGRGVQDELLNIIEGTKEMQFESRDMMRGHITMNPGKVLFIAAGVFDGLQQINGKKDTIGFGKGNDISNEKKKLVTTDDLVKFGLIRELIGRFPVTVQLSPLSEDDLVHIMVNSESSYLREYEKYFAVFGKKLELTERTVRAIARGAIAMNTGARGIKGVMEEFLGSYLFALGTPNLPDRIVVDTEDANQLPGYEANMHSGIQAG